MTDSWTRSTITAALAARLIASATEAAATRGFAFSVAVVDESGVLKGFSRMDSASLTSGPVATDKAYTAAGGRPTHLWQSAIQGDEGLLLGARDAIPRLVTLGGGFPVVVDGAVVGGIGVSGGHYTQDMEIALAALREAGLKHEW